MAFFGGRLRHAWNAFMKPAVPRQMMYEGYGESYFTRPDRLRLSYSAERSIISSVYTRIGIDTAAIDIRHVRLDENERYIGDMPSYLNECLILDSNIDQTGRAFRQDLVMTLMEKGVVAIVPVDTTTDPRFGNSYDIKTLRVGTIVEWFPKHVRVKVYNEQTGHHEEIVLLKTFVAIMENPLYSVMNEPNSTMQRLIQKLAMLDVTDKNNSSGKLDLILQLPYVVKSETRREQAERRRKDIEVQLTSSQYGIAYTDGTERITQLNRPVENTMLDQIKYLTTMLYSQLGLTEGVFNGTASDEEMLNYYNRTIEPILTAITESMARSFLTRTARTQGQSIRYFRDPFKLVPVNQIAEIADKFTRNEIASSNEIRNILGWKPSDDPKSDELRNSNMPAAADGAQPSDGSEEVPEDDTDSSGDTSAAIEEIFQSLEASIEDILGGDDAE